MLPPDAGSDTGLPSEGGPLQIDPCTANPCEHGGACISDSGTYTCSCTDGHAGTNCELEICGDTPIRSHADVESNRSCAEIHGNLNISAVGLAAITADDFPALTKITGDLLITGVQSGQAAYLRSVTLSKLQTVEGAVFIQSVALDGTSKGPLSEVHLPALTTIGIHNGDGLMLVQAGIKVLDLPVLMRVDGSVEFSSLFELCTLNLRKIKHVGGNVQISWVPKLSATALAPLRSAAAGTVAEGELGCCWANSMDAVSCTFASTNTTYCTGC